MNGSNHLLYVLIFAATLFVVPFFLKNKHTKGSIQDTVNALGILGTFTGIIFGLFHLDFTNLQEGIPELIKWLTYGFIASVAGFTASLVVKHTDIYGIPEGTKDLTDKEILEEIREEIKKVNMNLSGEGETTLVTQIQKMRTSTADKLDELNKSFNEFAKQMADNNVSALIEAVNKVMEDFNAKINDQLGESFKELSSSVKNLVEWQKDYMVLIKASTEALGAAQESLKTSSDSLNNTSDKVAQITESNKQIQELNKEFVAVMEKLNQMLEASVGFSNGMKSLADELSGNGETIKKELKSIVEASIKDMRTHAEEFTLNVNSMAETSLKNMQEKNTQTLKSFEELNLKTLQDFGGHLASISGKMVEDFRKVQEALSVK
jgi:methyl-accepting chemotaxis protein